jgi:hypothetical protein
MRSRDRDVIVIAGGSAVATPTASVAPPAVETGGA